ncbi:CoA transferase [Glaciihabitans sp. UYNi722]|uniref:CoA transferase n=1 Tax=Glaciihabitans sp. UYNi722 TaxID=3156344 RepID=UPI00339235A7
MLVLDFSQFLAGPVAAMRLADLGARVIKIERPQGGDIGRTLAFAGRTADGDTVSFHAMNRNKEGITADLKDPDDLAYVKRLVAKADVIIQNFRPGVMERIGLDYESVRKINPTIVYASASGYGDSGPWKDRPGHSVI